RDVEVTDKRSLARERGHNRGADAGASTRDNHSFPPQARVDRGMTLDRDIFHWPSRPRAARFLMSADNPKVHGGAASHVVTLFSRTPRRSLKTRTRSPGLC